MKFLQREASYLDRNYVPLSAGVSLTAGRVPFAAADGLTDDSGLTFNSATKAMVVTGSITSSAAASAVAAPNGHVLAVSFRASGDDGAVNTGEVKMTATTGIGNGVNTNIQAPVIGTGGGPATATLVTTFIKFWKAGAVVWIPAMT